MPLVRIHDRVRIDAGEVISDIPIVGGFGVTEERVVCGLHPPLVIGDGKRASKYRNAGNRHKGNDTKKKEYQAFAFQFAGSFKVQ